MINETGSNSKIPNPEFYETYNLSWSLSIQ